MFDKHVLEAMLARLRSKSDAGMFWHVLACFALAQHGKRPCACLKNVLEAMLARLRSKSDAGMFWHVLACFGFCFGPTWEEALCMFENCAGRDAGTFTF